MKEISGKLHWKLDGMNESIYTQTNITEICMRRSNKI